MTKSKWFSESEFNRCTPRCSLQDMKQELMTPLDKAREIADIPFLLTSAYRSKEWDRAKGRSGTGSHTLGLAVDIVCRSSTTRWKVVNALLKAGFKRIGIYKTFIHADVSGEENNHPTKIIW